MFKNMQQKQTELLETLQLLTSEVKELREQVAGLRGELKPELSKTATIQRVKQEERLLSNAITRFLTRD